MVECHCPDSNGPSYVHSLDCLLSKVVEEHATARPTWDEYGMILARAVLTRAACSRRQVGAVILNDDNEIVSTGYNGTPRGMTNCSDGGCPRGLLSYAETPAYGSYDNCTGRHAEDNAIYTAHNRGQHLTGCTIYVTHDPCDDCAAKIMRAGITRVISPNQRG